MWNKYVYILLIQTNKIQQFYALYDEINFKNCAPQLVTKSKKKKTFGKHTFPTRFFGRY